MKSNRLYEVTGSPGLNYSAGKLERAAQFGLNYENEESFEGNQSFPRALHTHHHHHSKKPDPLHVPDFSKMKGLELNSVSFLKQNLLKNHNNSTMLKNNYLNSTEQNGRDISYNNHNNTSHYHPTCMFDKSWAFYNQFANTTGMIVSVENQMNAEQPEAPIVAVANPNKALVVINGRTTEILTANNISCDLFGLNETKLIGRKLRDLFDFSSEMDGQSGKTPAKRDFLMESDRLDENGKIVLCSGKIFDVYTDVDGDGGGCDSVMPVSIYMLKLTDEAEPKCLCAMEPVQRVTGTFAINIKGQICYYNPNFSYMFGFTSSSENQLSSKSPSSLSLIATNSILKGMDINELIPHMKLPMGNIQAEVRKQTLTGRNCKGENFPLKLSITNKQVFNNEEIVYNCKVSVYTNISGLVTINPTDLKINSCNATFSRLLFGYDEKDLIDKPITFLIPNFLNPENASNLATANTTRLNSTNQRMTPLGVNNSYLNVHEHNNYSSSRNNSLRHQASGAPGYRMNRSRMNQSNGSFLEAPSTPNQNRARPQIVIEACPAQANAPESNKTLGLEEAEPVKMPAATSCCSSCGEALKASKGAADQKQNPFLDFNLDYSPNKKCANFIETNTFLPGSPAPSNMDQISSSIHCSAKKSLLAKAISNNTLANEVKISKLAMDDDLASTTSSLSSASSLTSLTTDDLASSSPTSNRLLNKSRSFTNLMNVSELENTPDPRLCHKCAQSKRKDTLNAQNENDTSVVSLIATEQNEISIEEEDFMNEENAETVKPKVTKRARLSDNVHIETGADENRRSSMLLDADYTEKSKKFKNQVTSTPAASAPNKLLGKSAARTSLGGINQSQFQINDGTYLGRGRHSDGSFLRLIYHRKVVHLNEEQANRDLVCVWISRDPYSYSDKSILEYSVDQSMMKSKRLNQTVNDQNAYLMEYDDLICLGRGASGFVQLARRKVDKFEVVTKYILKSKIYKENWIDDQKYALGKIPLECSILCKLDHANIIKVLDVFQDEDHVQMIMEKHGCGMDLFEFIDRQRRYSEEPLVCHIFKQIISAVAYMHENNLVHRDIKDENIVINQQFHIKLIDFGSTAYMVKGKKFATFCGTLDYCSPDVLLGNKYYGPELDIWTCGIALYTLVFSENPFVDAEETIECILKPPFKVSKELMRLLFAILCKDPQLRATIPEIQADKWMNQPIDMSNYKWEEVIRDTEFHANNAGNIFREDDLPPCDVNNQQKENMVQNEDGVKLEKINDYNKDSSCEMNNENNKCNLNKFNAIQNLNQISVLSKSF